MDWSRTVQEYSKYGRLLSDEEWADTVHFMINASGPEQLVYEDVLKPVPGSNDALVRVCAAGITPTELSWSSTCCETSWRVVLRKWKRRSGRSCGWRKALA